MALLIEFIDLRDHAKIENLRTISLRKTIVDEA